MFFRQHFAGIATIILLAAGVGGIVYSYRNAQRVEQERETVRSSGTVPVALLEETQFDWGEIDRDNIVEQSFTLKNPSAIPLRIIQIATSCGCTTAELLLEGATVELPSSIPPGGEGEVLVRFDPAMHEARGSTDRAVRIETNDPDNPFLIINLKAYVR